MLLGVRMGGHHFLPSWVRLSILVRWACSLVAMPHWDGPGEEEAELSMWQRSGI